MELTIVSLYFYLALAASIILYYLLPKNLQWLFLLALSLAFCFVNSSLALLALFAGIVLAAYLGALVIDSLQRKIPKRISCIIVVILLAGTLFYCKDLQFLNVLRRIYGNFFILSGDEPVYRILPLLGISYFTLCLIGYVLDVYWEKYPPEKNYLKLLLFAGYFPQLTSGPITRYDEMRNQLFTRHTFDANCIIMGAERIIWGLFKKLVLADRAAIAVENIFYAQEPEGLLVLVGVLIYAFRLYTDFSGCMDIVLGVSECFQIKLPENFNTPFASRTFAEFWRRWHITMGVWFKDYVFYPLLKSGWFQRINQWFRKKLGRKYGKKIATCLGLTVVWFSIGLWHGGSATFIAVSGIIPGCILILEELLESPLKKVTQALRINTECFSWRLFSHVRVLLSMCIAWIFMCSPYPKVGLARIASVVSVLNPWILHDGTLLQLGLDIYDWMILLVGLLLLIVVGVWHERGVHIRIAFQQQNLVFRWLFLLAALFTIIIFGIYGPGYDAASFIYKQF